jgi:hypothetical protein
MASISSRVDSDFSYLLKKKPIVEEVKKEETFAAPVIEDEDLVGVEVEVDDEPVDDTPEFGTTVVEVPTVQLADEAPVAEGESSAVSYTSVTEEIEEPAKSSKKGGRNKKNK